MGYVWHTDLLDDKSSHRMRNKDNRFLVVYLVSVFLARQKLDVDRWWVYAC